MSATESQSQSNGAALPGGSLASPGVPIRPRYASRGQAPAPEAPPELAHAPRAIAAERLSVAVDRNVGNEEAQARENERDAERHGWTITEHYGRRGESADVDKETWSGYFRIWDAVAAGEVDAIIATDADRVSRSTVDIALLFRHCVRHGVRRVSFGGRVFDPANATDKMTATILGAVGEMENAIKKRRALRKAEQNALAGKPQQGRRPFGYKADKVTLEPAEALVIRELMTRALAGAPISRLARELNEKGVKTANGATWYPATVRQVLWNWRIAGIRSHNDIPVKADAWPAIVDKSEVEAFRLMSKPGQARTGRPKALLAGLVFCECHGYRMNSHRSKTSDEYRANGGSQTPRCIVSVSKAELDAFVAREFFRTIADGAWRSEADANNALRLEALEAELAEIAQARDDEAKARALGKLSLAAFQATERYREERETELRAEVASVTLAPTYGALREAEEAWPNLTDSERRKLLDVLIERVEYRATERAAREPFDGSRHARIVWRPQNA